MNREAARRKLAEVVLPYVARVCVCQMFDGPSVGHRHGCGTLAQADKAAAALLPVVNGLASEDAYRRGVQDGKVEAAEFMRSLPNENDVYDAFLRGQRSAARRRHDTA